jgi:hypothetical protein
MDDIDDPLLALILRFVAPEPDTDLPREACMRLQIALIQEHIAKFPHEDRQVHAIEWVEQHARNFREECRGKLVAAAMANATKCRDCPLLETADTSPCVIHERWAGLVHQYVDQQISSADYVRSSLTLLQDHKDQLKVTRLRQETGMPASI